MITIAEPNDSIDKLWGKQKVREVETYRLMRYVLRVDHEDKVLLHNVVTGRLAVLDWEEAEALETLPGPYIPAMEQLVTEHYLVPENYDEHQQTVSLRTILRKIADAHESKEMYRYTILPTTDCNARCYYCYEHGIHPETMTEQTAELVIDFIKNQYKGHPIRIRWLGGEPTLAAHRIDQICNGLKQRGVEFSSWIISNGYLFDEGMIERSKRLWNLVHAKISVDGTRETYNRVKAFHAVKEDPYQRVIRNIGTFLNHGIHVLVSMNVDRRNYQEFRDLLFELKELYQQNPLLQVRPHQLMPNYLKVNQAVVPDAEEAWYQEKLFDLKKLAQTEGFLFQAEEELPSLRIQWCEAAKYGTAVIMPDGRMVKCPEQLADDQVIGDVIGGITNEKRVMAWRQFADYERCRNCPLFPYCPRIQQCGSQGRCYEIKERMSQFRYQIERFAEAL